MRRSTGSGSSNATAENWPLLLAQLLTFNYIYPGYRGNVPGWVLEDLFERARAEDATDDAGADFTRGPLISRFSFSIDVKEWGFEDPSVLLIRGARREPDIQTLVESSVWDERSVDHWVAPTSA